MPFSLDSIAIFGIYYCFKHPLDLYVGNLAMSTDVQDNPCLTCGACCAYYRASFYWAEADDAGGTVPVELTEKMNDFRRVMIGTNQPNPRCIALEGTIGKSVYCRIYDKRASVCREFKVAWEDGSPNPRCDKARIAWGLTPLKPRQTTSENKKSA